MKEKYREDLNQNLTHSAPTMRQQQALARREQIIEAAVRLFAQYGFDGTSTRQIAREVSITEGLIFHYFPTKADLLTAVLETPHSFLGELSNILMQDREQPASLVLSRIANEWLRTLRREAAFTTFLLGTAQTNAQVGGILQALIQQGMSSLVMYLKGRVQQGELRLDLPLETCAHMFFSSLIIFFMTCRSLPDAEWEVRAATFTQELVLAWLTGARG